MILSILLIAAAAVIGGVVAAGAPRTALGLFCAGFYWVAMAYALARHNLVEIYAVLAMGAVFAACDAIDRRREKAA